MESSHKSNIRADIPSDPEALLGFKCRTNETISSFLMRILSIILSVRKLNVGNVQLLVISLH